jgi:(2Fe-2S) ferredoxin
VSSLPGFESVRRFAFAEYDDLRGVDLATAGEPVANPLFLVCTHGKHDPCCARKGRPVFEALAEQLEDEWAWQATHIGGDRFAGNVVCLPHGLYYGRVEREDAVRLLDEHFAGRVLLDRYRGRSIHPFAVQAVEQSVREDTGLTAIDALRLERVDGTRVAFASADGVHERVVEERPGEPAFLTCNAGEERRPLRFVVRPA